MGNDFEPLATVLRSACGVDITVIDPSFLERTVEKRREAAKYPSLPEYVRLVQEHRAEQVVLLQALRINYSEFFRDRLAYAVVEEVVLPRCIEAKRAGRELRIWSSGCAAGQEAYSLAMALHDACARQGDRLSFRIFATDIAEPDLAIAREGVYPAEALANVTMKRVRDYGIQRNGMIEMAPSLKSCIEFSYYDLLDDRSGAPPSSIFGDFDLVVCANLLFYYREEVRRRILDKLRRSLGSGGYLMTGDAERSIVEQCGLFLPVVPPAAVYRT